MLPGASGSDAVALRSTRIFHPFGACATTAADAAIATITANAYRLMSSLLLCLCLGRRPSRLRSHRLQARLADHTRRRRRDEIADQRLGRSARVRAGDEAG